MPTAATTTPQSTRQGALPVRPSGVMPAFRGKVSLPAPGLRLAKPVQNDDAEWAAAIALARQRALVEEEEREWAALQARARALAAEEEREWAALRARATPRRAPVRPARRVVSWP